MKKQWWYVLITSLIISFFIDKQILNFFIKNRTEILNNFIIWFTNIYILIGIGIIITFFIFLNKTKRKYILPLWISGLIGYLAAILLKLIFIRQRPDVITLIPISNYSFPSAHATVIFSLLPILYKKFKKLIWFWITFGILVLFSRLYVGVHYPSDLIAGTILGLIIGTILYKRLNQ